MKSTEYEKSDQNERGVRERKRERGCQTYLKIVERLLVWMRINRFGQFFWSYQTDQLVFSVFCLKLKLINQRNKEKLTNNQVGSVQRNQSFIFDIFFFNLAGQFDQLNQFGWFKQKRKRKMVLFYFILFNIFIQFCLENN